MSDYSLGVDIGGTFTDIVVYDHTTNQQLNRKVLTTHDDPSRAVIDGAAHLLDAHELNPGEFSRFVHATTLFTNALVERKGAVTGLLTTDGFRDFLEIGGERKYERYDIASEKPEPLGDGGGRRLAGAATGQTGTHEKEKKVVVPSRNRVAARRIHKKPPLWRIPSTSIPYTGGRTSQGRSFDPVIF